MKKVVLLFVAAFFVLMPVKVAAGTPKGHLIIIGGGITTADMRSRFIDYAGGRDAKCLIISTAAHKPEEAGKKFIASFNGENMYNVRWVAPTRQQADDPEFVKEYLEGVTGVFFTGGLQKRISDSLRGTEMHKKLMSMYEEDGIVIAGTSAGAGMMPDPMVATSKKPLTGQEKGIFSIKPGNSVIMPGMGFLKNAIIDQHFVIRSRHNRFYSAAFDHPELTAFAIDESTAMVVSNGNEVEIVGESSVTVVEVDASAIKQDKNGNYGCSGMTVRMLLDGDKYIIKPKN